MKVSIITATFNSSLHIADCISSVNNQTWQDIEHIIIDGSSEDNTLEIIRNTANRITKVVSEPDSGIYDAFNKGITIATGDIIGILNSDDFFVSNDIVEEISKTFEQENCDAIFGHLDFVSSKDPSKVIRRWKSSPFQAGSFARGWHLPHPTFYVKREIYEKFGQYDVSLSAPADFELTMRFLEKCKIRSFMLDRVMVYMRYGGESTGSIWKIFVRNRDYIRAFRKNGLKVSPFYIFMRLIPKIRQFF